MGIIKEIWLQLKNYNKLYGEPNIIYVGYKQFMELKQNNDFFKQNPHVSPTEDYKLFGFPLQEVAKENYLAVGYVEEVEEVK